MASPALSADDIRVLARNATTYWKDEASVNGIWVGLLANAFHGNSPAGSDKFVLQPEGQGEISKKRNDILVRKITNFTTGDQTAYLVFEGKSSDSKDNLDTAARQLYDFVNDSPRLSRGQRIWGIVAKGHTFRLLFYSNQKETKLLLPKPGAATGRPTEGAPSPDYDLGRDKNLQGSVEGVVKFLAYARDHLNDWVA